MKQGSGGLFWLACSLLLATLAASRMRHAQGPDATARPLEEFPVELAGWRGSDDAPLAENVARSLGASSYLSRVYQRDGRAIHLFIAYYANPRAGETMHSPKHCLPGAGWEPVQFGAVPLGLGDRTVSVNRYLLYRAGQQTLVLYWYQTAERVIASEYQSKAYLIWDTLARRRPGSSVVRLALEARPGALEEGRAFASQVIPALARIYRP
jgi:EpsI family protein